MCFIRIVSNLASGRMAKSLCVPCASDFFSQFRCAPVHMKSQSTWNPYMFCNDDRCFPAYQLPKWFEDLVNSCWLFGLRGSERFFPCDYMDNQDLGLSMNLKLVAATIRGSNCSMYLHGSSWRWRAFVQESRWLRDTSPL